MMHVVVSYVSPEEAVQTHLRLVLGVRHTWAISSRLAPQHGHILFIFGSSTVYFCLLDALSALFKVSKSRQLRRECSDHQFAIEDLL